MEFVKIQKEMSRNFPFFSPSISELFFSRHYYLPKKIALTISVKESKQHFKPETENSTMADKSTISDSQ